MPQAIEWSLATPITSPRLPCINAFMRRDVPLQQWYDQASSRLNTTDALVPPNPNELDSTQPSSTSSRRSRTMGTSANAGSSVSMLALSQMKPLFIIRIEYTASCTPAAPSEWPVSDFVAAIGGHLSPNTSRIASISLRSPIGVAVACGVM